LRKCGPLDFLPWPLWRKRALCKIQSRLLRSKLCTSSSTLRSAFVLRRLVLLFRPLPLLLSFVATLALLLRSRNQLNRLLPATQLSRKQLLSAKPLASSASANNFILAILLLVLSSIRPPVRLAMSAPTQIVGSQIICNPNTSLSTNISEVMTMRSGVGRKTGPLMYLT
jgi:hypothetical protein